MSVDFTKYVEDIATVMDTYNEIRLFRDVSPTGAFATAVDTAALVADQQLYDLSDDSGNANYVYVIDFYHTTTGATSPRSDPFYPEGVSLLRLRLEAARQAGAGFDGTCTDDGTTTTLIDAVLLDNGVDADYGEGLWLYRPNASLTTDMLRRVAREGFDDTTGTFTLTRAYSNAPADDEVYHAFMFYPPIRTSGVAMSWDDIIRAALREIWYVDQVDLGPGTTDNKRRFSITDTVDVQRSQVRRVLIRRTDDNGNIFDHDAGTMGGFWQFVDDGPGNLSIDVYPTPNTSENVVVEVNRQPAALYNDTDVLDIRIEYAIAAVKRRLFWQLNSDQPGKYTVELAEAQQDFDNTNGVNKPGAVLRGV